MRHRLHTNQARASFARLALALALGAVGLVGIMTFGKTPNAHAASQGSVFVYPPAGGPGTRVRLELHFFGDTHLYLIKVATKPTNSGGCDNAQALSGEGGKPVQLGGQDVTNVDFDWPANLASRAYYFCVFPAAYPTATPTATTSGTPLSTPAGGPTATPRPTPPPIVTGPNQASSTVPFFYTRDASATVALPNPDTASAAAGAQVTVTLTKWLSQNRAAPTSVVLMQVGQQDSPNEDAPVSADFSVTTPPDSKGNCTLSVTIPANLNSGPNQKGATQPYLMVVGGPGIFQRSDPFAITPTITPTVSVTPTPTHVAGGSGGGGLLVVIGWIVAFLAFLGAVGGVLYLALSRRAGGDAPSPGAGAPWAGPPDSAPGGSEPGGWGLRSPTWDQWGQGSPGSTPDWDAPTEPGRWPEDRR
jgi:hypothetical protein